MGQYNSGMEMEIIELSSSDAPAYQQLRLYGLQESPSAFGSSYAEEVDRPLSLVAERLEDQLNHVFGAANEKGDLVGVITLRREGHIKGAHKAYIFAMYVLPEYRKRGIGRALTEEAIARAAELGLRQVSLSVVSSNQAAVNLYKSCGFELFGLEKEAFLIEDKFFDLAYLVRRLVHNH